MSPLYRDTVWVELGAEQIAVTRRAGWMSRSVSHAQTYPVSTSSEATIAERSRVSLEVLQTALADSRWQAARARVTLTNALVRYCIVPASDQTTGIPEEHSLAQTRLQQVHGTAGPRLEVRLSNPLSGRDQLAAGLDSSLLSELMSLLSRARLRVLSIEPLLVHAFNRIRPRIAAQDFMFACVERGMLGLGCVRSGGWQSLDLSMFRGEALDALTSRLSQAALETEDPKGLPREIYVHAQSDELGLHAQIAGLKCHLFNRVEGR